MKLLGQMLTIPNLSSPCGSRLPDPPTQTVPLHFYLPGLSPWPINTSIAAKAIEYTIPEGLEKWIPTTVMDLPEGAVSWIPLRDEPQGNHTGAGRPVSLLLNIRRARWAKLTHVTSLSRSTTCTAALPLARD